NATFNDPLTGATSGFQVINSEGFQVIFGAANVYGGATTITGNGLLQLTADNGVPITSALTLNGGATFDLNSHADAIGSLAGVASVTLGSGGTLTTGNDNTSTAFSGNISGNGAVIKVGTGAWTLSGASTYTGGTTVNGGKLIVSGSISGTASVTVGDGTHPATLGG